MDLGSHRKAGAPSPSRRTRSRVFNDWRQPKIFAVGEQKPVKNQLSMPKTFYTQYTEERPKWRLATTLPSCTVPDQSLTISEIIAKYTRHGLVPNSITKADQGGNVALEPGLDPMDEWNDVLASARAEAESAERVAGPAGGEDNVLPSGGAGETGGASSAGEGGTN